MASQLSARTMPDSTSAEPATDDIMRMLLRAVSAEEPEAAAAASSADQPREEIVLDVDLDGARYLLVRMPRAERPRVQLSPREQEIVRMVAQGHSNKIIADVLAISSWTVCTHLRRIFAKLGVGSRAAMVARLMEINGDHGRKPADRVSTAIVAGARRCERV